jgi:hypothetical protein
VEQRERQRAAVALDHHAERDRPEVVVVVHGGGC